VMGIALPNNSSLARVVRASFAIDRFRRRFCHCYSAPFRLDTLNKFSVVRSSIKPREKKAMRSTLRTALSDSGPAKLRIQADSFDVVDDGGLPTLRNIVGVGAHKFLWLDITEIQLKQNQGQRVIHVVTSGGSRDFVL